MTPAGRVLMWSPAAAALFGRSAARAIGRDAGRTLVAAGDGTPDDGDALTTTVRAATAGEPRSRVLPALLGDGRAAPLMFHCERMTGADGRTVVAVSVCPGRDAHPAAGAPSPLTGSAVPRIGGSLDLRETAREFAGSLSRSFCDAVGVYVLERLLVDDETPAPRAAGARVVVRRLALRVHGGESGGEWAAALPAGEVVAYTPDAPQARCMSERRAIAFGRLDAQTLQRVRERVTAPEQYTRFLRYERFLTVPLVARGEVLGFAVLARGATGAPFTQADADAVRVLADHTAVCMDNGRIYDRERRTSATLQNSLLPVDLAAPKGMRVAGRSLPAGAGSRIGGDWYDTIPLPGGRVGLVVGDAMGHGTAAALAMGQLRTAVRILSRLGLPPARLLGRLDEIAQELTTAQFATCVYAEYDPDDHAFTLARAGHVPPVLAHADGTSEVIELPPGLPLGVAQADYEASRVPIPAGGTLVLCTDGLVERRDRAAETGLGIMRATLLTERSPDLEGLCDAIVKNLDAESGGDDATLLLARLDGEGSGP